jgi:hypothetical protein
MVPTDCSTTTMTTYKELAMDKLISAASYCDVFCGFLNYTKKTLWTRRRTLTSAYHVVII